MYPEVQLFIDNAWTKGAGGKTIPVLNPATGEEIGKVAHAEKADLDRALAAADKGFKAWKKVSPFDRYKVLRKAADIIRSRADEIGKIMSMEQGKPFIEAKGETMLAGDIMDWFAEEARRTYGRIVPPRAEGVYQLVVKEPVGPVAAFTPWNFPINQAVRKCSAAIAAGCSIILKGPEETPAACAALVQAYVDAGVPAGVIQLVYGIPSEISEYLIPHPVIRKITFTGSTPVGKHLSMLAGQHMKRITMELGGHAPAIVFEDADVDTAIKVLSANKFRNAGQVCVSPTRFLVHEKVYGQFVQGFTDFAKSLKVGDGMDKDTRMGPLANDRRVQAMEMFVADAVSKGAKIETGGKRIGNKGNFFEPTVMTNINNDMRIMNEEPFGPLAPIIPFSNFDAVVEEANRLPFGLAAYAYTKSAKTAAAIGAAFESGMVSINHHGLALPEVPFGGIKDSGYGSEGGSEAIESYLNTKFITQVGL
ncbi:NAD-dependent succinate-semialdehyde dehydrogenase [Ferrovibrio terrae]|uniref:NAD-dependent succinate-semialdehyde dehydrogenase n=1 Tax=Ferrovibrio terrae TaxID=2594003 RepID=A0A516H522_9PROT|nr:NAD-dependent succinate-semialdehyde dehydrogenase [Ferrovibrio terrae]QDO98835.1 NAD-dependent succinate-semialdehyde dehydrogenase [Ferrovibrio terrae]